MFIILRNQRYFELLRFLVYFAKMASTKITFPLGANVCINNQTRRPELNGQQGKVCSIEKSDRVEVQLKSDRSVVTVQVKNLTWDDSNQECFHKFERHHIKVTKYVEPIFPFPLGAVVLINAMSFWFHSAFASVCSALKPDDNTVDIELFPLSGNVITICVDSLTLAPDHITNSLTGWNFEDLHDWYDDYDYELDELEEEQNNSDSEDDENDENDDYVEYDCMYFKSQPLLLEEPRSKFSLMSESEKSLVLCNPTPVSTTSKLSASAAPFVMKNQIECYGTYSESTNIESWAEYDEN